MVADGAEDQVRGEIQGLTDSSGGEDYRPDPAQGAGREPTGDDAVDEVLRQLDKVAEEPLDTQIEVGEQVHRILKNRLADLGNE